MYVAAAIAAIITAFVGIVKALLHFHPVVVVWYRPYPFVLYVLVLPIRKGEIQLLKEKGFTVLC